MAIIRDRVERDVIIKESTSIMGVVEGMVTVRKGANLQIHGLVIGKVLLERDSETFIHGMVNGDVVNQGGYLYVFGTVNGRIIEQDGGLTKIDAKAVVRDS